jgi:hypothetical protein
MAPAAQASKRRRSSLTGVLRLNELERRVDLPETAPEGRFNMPPRCLGRAKWSGSGSPRDPMAAKPVLGAGRILPRAAAPWGRGGSGEGSDHWSLTVGGLEHRQRSC